MTEQPNGRRLTIDELREMTRAANIPTLLMVIYQVTGDERWLRDPYRPTRSKGLGDHDSGGLPAEVQDAVREAGAQALHVLATGCAPAFEEPTPPQLARMLSVCVGEDVDNSYGDMFSQEFRRRIGIGAATQRPPATAKCAGFRVLVIGAGVSGIIAAQQLEQMGIDYLIVDKHAAPGGNWCDNPYPGCGVDTPSHLYSFSFAANDWTMHFEMRAELQEYLAKTFDTIGARSRALFNTDVVRAVYDHAGECWDVEMHGLDGSPLTMSFNAIISAVGILNRPKLPNVDGLEAFRGPSFHSSEWPQDLDVAGKRVALIGSGASAMQIAPAIADEVKHLSIFQRTPPWIAPFEKFQLPIDSASRELMRSFPLYRVWYWIKLFWQFGDKVLEALRKDPDWPHPERAVNARNDGHRVFFTEYIKDELGERTDLFDKVLPKYPPYGKRILLDNGWYRTLSKPNVNLIGDPVSRVTPHGVVTASGQDYEADVLVWATGFEASHFLASLEVVGCDGTTLREAWDGDDARAYLGVSVPGFPNLFMLGGPNSFPGSGSFMYFMEVQMRYIARLLDAMLAADIRAIDVRSDVFAEYNELLDRTSELTVWTHPGTNTFFRNDRGRLVFVSPFMNVEYWSRAERSGLDDYEVTPLVDASLDAASASA